MQLPPGVDGTIVMEDCGEAAIYDFGEESPDQDADFIIGEPEEESAFEVEPIATDVAEETSTDELIGGSEEGTE